jgi:hypothetical protein
VKVIVEVSVGIGSLAHNSLQQGEIGRPGGVARQQVFVVGIGIPGQELNG